MTRHMKKQENKSVVKIKNLSIQKLREFVASTLEAQKNPEEGYSGCREMIPDGNSDLQEGKKNTGNYNYVSK